MNERKKILEFITGDLLWDELTEAGIEIKVIDDYHCEISNKNSTIVKPGLRDIITGILKLCRIPNAIRRWAAIILGSTIIDLEKINNNENGDEILNILWDLSEGTDISKQQIELLNRIMEKE
jgi:hypothetical protein